MRSTAGPGIRCLSLAEGMPLQDLGRASSESHHPEPRAGQCTLGESGQWQGPLVGSSVPKGSRAPAVASVGHQNLTWTSVGGTPVCSGIQLRAGTRLPDRLTRLCGPRDTEGQRELLSMDSSAAVGASWDATPSGGSGGTGATGSLAPVKGSGPAPPCTPPGSQGVFTSSFSFIRLSLDSAGERGEAEGCLPSRAAETPHQGPQETGAAATSSDRPHEDPQCFPWPFCFTATWGLADSAPGSGSSAKLECGRLPPLHMDPGCSLSLDPSAGCGGDEDCGSGEAHSWDALLGRWAPVLRDGLLSAQRQLEVTSFKSKLQKLQEAAVEAEDYDKAEKLKQRLEDLERGTGGLQLVLPSRQPALRSFLGHLAAQAQATLHRAAQQASSEDAPLRGEQRLREPTAQDGLHTTTARRDWLLGEQRELQKEIESLQARMTVLQAKDQQLRWELEEQEQQLRGQHCGLTELLARLPLGQLQVVSKDLQDTLAAASQLHFQVEPPEDIRSLQERIKSLNLSLQGIAAEVWARESLCSSLRSRASHLEAQLPALLEAKSLAVSGGHFCIAKNLSEEIRSLGCEREGLEAILGTLQGLSSRSAEKLGRLQEAQDRLQGELACRTAAYEASMKEKAVTYVEMLEDSLRSCQCPLLQRVWEADLEACRLLLQGLELQEEDEGQRDGASQPHSEDEGRDPHAPDPHRAGGQQKEFAEKCEAIRKKLLHLEDELHRAMRSRDEELIQSLNGELQTVKGALQAMILQLQPAQEAEESLQYLEQLLSNNL